MRFFKWQIKAQKALPKLTLEEVILMSNEFQERYNEYLNDLTKRMYECEKAIEATRRKVYRDVKGNGEVAPENIPQITQPNPVTLITGTPVP